RHGDGVHYSVPSNSKYPRTGGDRIKSKVDGDFRQILMFKRCFRGQGLGVLSDTNLQLSAPCFRAVSSFLSGPRTIVTSLLKMVMVRRERPLRRRAISASNFSCKA